VSQCDGGFLLRLVGNLGSVVLFVYSIPVVT
jgi:hypothetical protein